MYFLGNLYNSGQWYYRLVLSRIEVDFGPDIGIKKSSAQITHYYETSALIGTQIIAVINFPPRNIAGYMSEFLILGIYDNGGGVILLRPDRAVDNGSEIG